MTDELCMIMDINKIHTSSYHPHCNGVTERYYRTLISRIGMLYPEKKANWKKCLPSLVCAYNAMKHGSIGFSPFELIFGRKLRLATDTLFRSDNDSVMSSNYVKDFKETMEMANRIAQRKLRQV